MKTITFNATEKLSLETSYAVLKQDEVILEITIGFKDDEYGWFELFDTDTGGDEWYAEGGLWFDGKELISYDGVFALPNCILDKLEELGYNVDYARI